MNERTEIATRILVALIVAPKEKTFPLLTEHGTTNVGDGRNEQCLPALAAQMANRLLDQLPPLVGGSIND